MALNLVDFWKRLIASGLTDATTPRQWAADYARDHHGKSPKEPLELAKWAIATGRLLPFQASSLIHGSPDIVVPDDQKNSVRFPKMRIAPLTQTQETPPEPFPRWLGVTRDGVDGSSSDRSPQRNDRSPESSENATAGLVLQIEPYRVTPQDGDRLRAMAASAEPGLPAFELIGLPGGPLGHRTVSMPIDETIDTIGLFAPLPKGPVLADSYKTNSRWPVHQIVDLIHRLAKPFASIVRAAPSGMPVPSADRIWVGDPGKPIYWPDPVEQLSPGVFDFSNSLRQTESRFLYTPPERLGAAGQEAADESAMVYSLGCLAYRLRTGTHAFAAAKDDQIRSRQLNFEPPEFAKAVAEGAAGDPMFRVLAYAMAKDPAQRFATIEQFTTALGATVPATQQPATQQPVVTTPLPAKKRPVKQPLANEPAVEQPTPPTPAASSKPTKKSSASKSTKTETKRAKVALEETAQPSVPETPPKLSKRAESERPADSKQLADSKQPEAKTRAESKPLAAPAAVPPAVAAASVVPAASRDDERNPVEPAPRRRPRRRRTTWYVLHSLWIPIALLIVANALQDPNASRPVAKRIRPPIPAVIPSVVGSGRPAPTATPTTTTNATQSPGGLRGAAPETNQQITQTPAKSGRIEVVQDDAMLWAPPSAIQADSLSGTSNQRTQLPPTILLPPGPAAIVTIDYPNLIASGLPDTFAPEIAPLLDALKKRIVVPLDTIAFIAMAWFPGNDGFPQVAVAVHLKQPRPLAELTELWKVSEARGKGGVSLFASDEPDGFAYYPNPVDPASSATPRQVAAFAVGSIDQITEVAEVEGGRVLLPRQLEDLWKHADPSDAIAMLTQPNFLVADARGWVAGVAPPLLDWIRGALIPECGGMLFRVAVNDDSDTYVEARLSTAPGLNPVALRTKLEERLDQATASAEDFLVTREIDPSWRLLASRLPNMWAFADDQTRSMIYERDVIFNTYLPSMALPQLTLATLLASNTTALTATANGSAATEKLTIEQLLDRPMSISFGQESLQFAIDTIVNEFSEDLPAGNKMPPVEIIGGDLQLMGITQNQQIRDFTQDKVPLRKVLTDLVLGANPDKTATGSNDPKQALVWVVVGEGDATKILVTTREASKDKYTLPKEFVVP